MAKLQAAVIARRNKKGKKEFYARIRWIENGKPRTKERKGQNKSHAGILLDQMKAEFGAGGSAAIDAERMTVRDLIQAYTDSELIPAVYAGERKIAGHKHPAKVKTKLRMIERFLGSHSLQSLSYEDLKQFKLALLAKETRLKRPRSIADVNGHLRILRAMLNFARRKRWIKSNPFHDGAPLISDADETPRDRPERDNEQERLLSHCTGRREHLRAMVICAIDTGLRYSEMMRIRADDVDLKTGVITARMGVTKTNRVRFVPITPRLAVELRRLMVATAPGRPLFGGIRSIKTAWRSLCKDAGIAGLQFRDLRHWAADKITEAAGRAGLTTKHAMQVMGHTQEKTFRRYLRKDAQVAAEIAAAMADERISSNRKA